MTKLERIFYPDKIPIATGKLTFSVRSSVTNKCRNWTDGKRQIEQELPAMLLEFNRLVSKQKQVRADALVKQELKNEELKIFRERESQSYLEKSSFEEAMKEAKVFIEHQNLETYLSYLEIQYSEKYGAFSEQAIIWFSMIRRISLGLNPSVKRVNLLNKLDL